MKKDSNIVRFLSRLSLGYIVTPLEALSLNMGMRLGARVHDLKNMGIDVTNLEKRRAEHAKYRLNPESQRLAEEVLAGAK